MKESEYGDLDSIRLMYFVKWALKTQGQMARSDYQSLSVHEALIKYEEQYMKWRKEGE